MMPSMKVLTIWNFALSLSWLDYQQNSSYNPSQPRQKSSKSACLFWPRLWPKCVRKRVDAMDKTLQNPALFADGTDVFGVKTLHITNQSQLAVMRSAVRSRLSPPKRLVFKWKQAFFIIFLMFLTYRRYFAPPAVVPTSAIPPQKLNKKFVKSY